jgi:diguanylate cyclase (GGDEF)-like protein
MNLKSVLVQAQRTCDVLFSCCRDIDTPSRFGGDEFALVLPETNVEGAKLVAQRICKSVDSEDKGPKISVSIGSAVYPQDGETIEQYQPVLASRRTETAARDDENSR